MDFLGGKVSWICWGGFKAVSFMVNCIIPTIESSIWHGEFWTQTLDLLNVGGDFSSEFYQG